MEVGGGEKVKVPVGLLVWHLHNCSLQCFSESIQLCADTTPPKEVLKNGRMTFIEAGFVPAAIVHVGVESSDMPLPVLSEEILKEAKSGLEAELVVAKKRETSQ